MIRECKLVDKDELLKAYWDIPHCQVETSIALGMEHQGK